MVIAEEGLQEEEQVPYHQNVPRATNLPERCTAAAADAPTVATTPDLMVFTLIALKQGALVDETRILTVVGGEEVIVAGVEDPEEGAKPGRIR